MNIDIVGWWNNHKPLAHMLTGMIAAIGATWASSSAFRAWVENTIHCAPHWIQAIAGFGPFAVLIYTNFKRQAQ